MIVFIYSAQKAFFTFIQAAHLKHMDSEGFRAPKGLPLKNVDTL
jgi:hypothetical protein